MRLLDHINDSAGFSPAQHLAVDEILLRDVADQDGPTETLRIWEASQTAVVVGRSSQVESEVDVARCERQGVPVLRRCSGGCAIVAGPGCLMYTVVLDLKHRPHLRVIDQAHEFVLEKILTALRRVDTKHLAREGMSDLVVVNGEARGQDGDSRATHEETIAAHKFSGNSLRITRDALLYHGTILYDFPIAQISDLLRQPPREPTYRNQRDHQQFVANLDVSREEFIPALCSVWGATEPMTTLAMDAVHALVTEKYANREWNYRH